MRQICESQKTNEKLPQVHLTPLKLRFALKRQTVPQTEPADPQNRSASSFIVCRSLFLVRCLSSPRVVRVVLVSCSGRVLGAQHDCRNVPSSLSLPPLFRWLRLCCSSLASLASPPCSTLGCLGDVFNAKQAAVKRMFVAVVALVFLLFFGGCSS